MKIYFNQLKKKHLESVRGWRNSLDVKKYMYTEPDISKQQQISWYKKISSQQNSKYWIINVDGNDLGLVCLTDIDHYHKKCSWAYYLGDPKSRGKGIGKQIELNILKYVFEKINFNKLSCEVFSFNKKVILIHQKFGSKIEGVLREHVFKNNQFHDVVIMSILKKEWEDIKNQFNIIEAEFE